MIKWDPTVNLGTLVAGLTLVGLALKIILRLDRIAFKVDEMWVWYKENMDDRRSNATNKN